MDRSTQLVKSDPINTEIVLVMYRDLITMHKEDMEAAQIRMHKARARNQLDEYLYALHDYMFSEDRKHELEEQYERLQVLAGYGKRKKPAEADSASVPYPEFLRCLDI